MNYSHFGWVPCINGHLDFGLIKPGITGGLTNEFEDQKTSLVNYSTNAYLDSHARKIMMQSKVDWKDTGGDDYNGQFRVFTVAETEYSDCLDGRELVGKIIIYL